jgi:polysaccharide biosynthesis protein PslE
MFDSIFTQMLRRQAVAIAIILAFGIGLTALTVIFAPRKYGSRAKLLLKLGRENASVDPTVTTTGDLVSLHRTYEGEVNTTLHTMASREILELVVDQVGVDAILRGSVEPSTKKKGLLSQLKRIPKGWLARLDPIDDREQAILNLQDDLVIKSAKQSSVIDISYTTKTPEMAQRVTQAWVDLYRAHHAEINATKGSLKFFVELESELADSLDQSRAALEAAKSKFGIITIGGEQQTLESQVRWVRSSLTETCASLKASEARLRSLEEQLRSTNSTMVIGKDKADTNEAQDRMRERLYELEIELQGLKELYSETHPKCVAANRQLQEARELFSKQKTQTERITEGVNSTYEALEQQTALEKANVDSMRAKMLATGAELDQLLERSTLLNQQENELAKLQRSVDILESQYRIHVQNREQARLASELESRNISNVNVFQAASLEQRPVSPDTRLCALLGLIGSLMSAIGIATWREAKRAGLLALTKVQNVSQSNENTSPPPRRTVELDYEQFHVNGHRDGSSVLVTSQRYDSPDHDRPDIALPLARR